MGSTIFQAPSYDARRERRKKILIAAVILAVVAAAIVLYLFRYHGYEDRVSNFFSDLQAQKYEAAYSIWMNDPDWKQHPAKYSNYPFNSFYRDWGPGGEWGVIHTFNVEGATDSGGSGVVVRVQVNHRAERSNIWVEKRDKTLTFSPYETIQ
jgi:hypothetical protein